MSILPLEEVLKWEEESVVLHKDEIRGRYFRSAVEKTKEEIVLSENPYVSAVELEKKTTTCDVCFETDKNGYSECCEQCKQVYFCCPQCKQKALSYHVYECGVLKLINDESIIKEFDTDMLCTMKIIIRVYAKRKWEKSSSYIYNRDTDNDHKYELTYSNLCELISNVEQLDEANKKKYLRGIDYLIALDTEQLLFDGNERNLMLEMWTRYECNSFGIYDGPEFKDDLKSLGAAFFLKSSFFNHSCDPNVYAQFSNGKMNFTLQEDVKKGDELTLSYISLSGDFALRQAECRNYFFECGCPKCKVDSVEIEKSKKVKPKTKKRKRY